MLRLHEGSLTHDARAKTPRNVEPADVSGLTDEQIQRVAAVVKNFFPTNPFGAAEPIRKDYCCDGTELFCSMELNSPSE